jgi:hypothetical protein
MSQLLFPDEIPVSEEEFQAWMDTSPNLYSRIYIQA